MSRIAKAGEADHLGTPRQAIDPATNTVLWKWDLMGSTFGANEADEDADNDGVPLELNLRFPGQYHDAEIGLHYNYFRDYEPDTGRYVETDPIGLVGGVSSYACSLGSPLYYFDSLGLSAECVGCDSRVTEKKVKRWCDRLIKRIRDASLATCVRKKCQTAQVRCKERCMVQCEGDKGFTSGGFAGLSNKGDNYITLCMDTDPSRDAAGGGWVQSSFMNLHILVAGCTATGVACRVTILQALAVGPKEADQIPKVEFADMHQTLNKCISLAFSLVAAGCAHYSRVSPAPDAVSAASISSKIEIRNYCWSEKHFSDIDFPRAKFIQFVNADLVMYSLIEGDEKLYCAYPVNNKIYKEMARLRGIHFDEYQSVVP